jgi:hypothetical protein
MMSFGKTGERDRKTGEPGGKTEKGRRRHNRRKGEREKAK